MRYFGIDENLRNLSGVLCAIICLYSDFMKALWLKKKSRFYVAYNSPGIAIKAGDFKSIILVMIVGKEYCTTKQGL